MLNQRTHFKIVCLVFAAVLMIVGTGVATAETAEPAVPLLEVWVTPQTLWVHRPCPNTLQVDLNIRNNALGGAPVTVDWTSAFGLRDIECVADYTPKQSLPAGVPVPFQTTVTVPITLSFIGDCAGRTAINFDGVIRGTADADAAILVVRCNAPRVPSLTPYGLLLLVLLLAGTAIWVIRRRSAVASI